MKRTKVMILAVSAGGVKKHIIDLVTGIDRSRFEVIGVFPDRRLLSTVIGDPTNTYSRIFKALGLRYFTLEIPRGIEIGADISGFHKLTRIIRQERPDVLHCHSSMAGALGRLAGIICRVPRLIYTPHLMYHCWHSGIRRLSFLILEKLLFTITDSIVLVSQSEYEDAVTTFSTRRRLALINNGVDVEYCRNYRFSRKEIIEGLGVENEALIVLSVTRLDPQKDIWTLLKAVALLPGNLPLYRVLIAGDGEEARACFRYVEDNRLGDRVKFLGWRDDVLDLIAVSDIGVLSSRKEGMPYSILETSAMAKPQIGSNVSGIKDGIVHGSTGWLFEVGDHKTLAGYLEKLLKDQKLRERFGKNGRDFVHNYFSLEAMIKKIERLYCGADM